MNPYQLNRAVARATGEDVDRIARMGFSLMVVPDRPPAQRRSRGRRRGRHRKRSHSVV